MILENQTEPIAINDVGGLLPGRPSIPTIWRWVTKGLLGPDSTRIKLPTVRIGGRRFVDPAALESFLAALQQDPSPAAAKTSQEADAARRAKAADAALEALGF